jgi:hypothetical protein
VVDVTDGGEEIGLAAVVRVLVAVGVRGDAPERAGALEADPLLPEVKIGGAKVVAGTAVPAVIVRVNALFSAAGGSVVAGGQQGGAAAKLDRTYAGRQGFKGRLQGSIRGGCDLAGGREHGDGTVQDALEAGDLVADEIIGELVEALVALLRGGTAGHRPAGQGKADLVAGLLEGERLWILGATAGLGGGERQEQEGEAREAHGQVPP